MIGKRRFLAGQSARSIAADLRARGVPTVNGGQWRTNTVLNILCSPTISGQREHRGVVVAPGVWAAPSSLWPTPATHAYSSTRRPSTSAPANAATTYSPGCADAAPAARACTPAHTHAANPSFVARPNQTGAGT